MDGQIGDGFRLGAESGLGQLGLSPSLTPKLNGSLYDSPTNGSVDGASEAQPPPKPVAAGPL
uniref:Uncharacterized protein n=1 Tax=Oryza punctata TaxID=4537 RepID=A0A0E0JW87_ORYPU